MRAGRELLLQQKNRRQPRGQRLGSIARQRANGGQDVFHFFASQQDPLRGQTPAVAGRFEQGHKLFVS